MENIYAGWDAITAVDDSDATMDVDFSMESLNLEDI